MKIAITGTNGLIGSATMARLESHGHHVLRLVRQQSQAGGTAIFWDPDSGAIDRGALEGIDALIHLAGESLATGRWNPAMKGRIRNSRVAGTNLLARTLAALTQKPVMFICASATGFYGNRDDEELTEVSLPGSGFLAEVCKEWEHAASPARDAGIRVVNLRTSMVLSPKGGALKKMLPAFRLGLGGRFGLSGRQYMSWIGLTDMTRAIEHLLDTPSLMGPVNLTSPSPVTNAEFTRTLGRVLRRPAWLHVPAPLLQLMFGEMADEAILASERVLPQRLQESGFVFEHPGLEGALRHELGSV